MFFVFGYVFFSNIAAKRTYTKINSRYLAYIRKFIVSWIATSYRRTEINCSMRESTEDNDKKYILCIDDITNKF